MWGIILGTLLILIGCAGMFIAEMAELFVAALAVGIILLFWGAIRLLQPLPEAEDEFYPEAENRPAPAQEQARREQQAAPALPPQQHPAPMAPGPPAGKQEPPPQAQPAAPPAETAPAVHIANAPQERPSPFQRGMRYLYAIDRSTGHKKAASCFIEGYENGDLNSGYMLCHCYKEGKGVPVKPVFVVQLAEYLVRRRFYPAYWHLASAYREGRGVPINTALAAEYAQKFEELCASPIEGIDEQLRYDALISYELQKDTPDLRVLEHLAREYYALSELPSRYSLLAFALLRDARCSATARAEILSLLEEGCRADDSSCYYLKGLLQHTGGSPLYPADPKRGEEYLLLAAERLGTPSALLSYLRCLQDSDRAEAYREKFWNACRWGISGIPGSDELHCSIRLSSATLPPAGDTPPAESPLILIKNEGDSTLHSAILRICCIDKQLDISIKIAPLAPAETLSINPENHQLDLGKRVYIEVHREGRYSRLYLRQMDDVLTSLITRQG